jgi:Trypsin-co-occurring domain 1
VSQVVSYAVEDGTVVQIEIEPVPGFSPAAGKGDVVGQVSEAIEPAIRAARVVLEKVRSAGPDDVQVKFGIKATGTTNWLVAKAAVEGNFEVTLTWNHETTQQA